MAVYALTFSMRLGDNVLMRVGQKTPCLDAKINPVFKK